MNDTKNGSTDGSNYKVGDRKPPLETRFTSKNQPDPERKRKAIRAHWERVREAQRIMDTLMDMNGMTFGQVKGILDRAKTDPDSLTMFEYKLAQYIHDKKMTSDWLDRHISKAPVQTDITTDGKALTGVVVEFIDGKNDTENTSDPGTKKDA